MHRILVREGLNRLDHMDRATGEVIRYERDRPGDLLHVDVKKFGLIPPGGGWKVNGRAGFQTGRKQIEADRAELLSGVYGGRTIGEPIALLVRNRDLLDAMERGPARLGFQHLRGEIVRESDGLAMSSRNQYLSPAERSTATVIHRTLRGMRDEMLAGTARLVVEARAGVELAEAGFEVDYTAVRTPDLVEPSAAPQVYAAPGRRVALIAARLGRTRLIDNIEFELP